MTEEQWMKFIDELWGMQSYWELILEYRKNPTMQGAFFSLSALATRNELLMRIAHVVHLCEEISKNFEIGTDATESLDEIRSLYTKGDSRNSAHLKFVDCGVKPFRDKVLAHPLNKIKTILGKDEIEISLPWQTIEQTIAKIKEFANWVEVFNNQAKRWSLSTYKDKIGDIDHAFRRVVIAFEDSKKFRQLEHKVALRGGKATVRFNWQTREMTILDDASNEGIVSN
ncbi:MAG: hypothetical protein WCL32_23580 [Planctomycetota bacterium]